MKTENYTNKMNVKAEMVVKMKALNEQLAVAREFKRREDTDAAKSAYKVVKDAHSAMHNALIEINKELREMRNAGEKQEVKATRKAREQKTVSFTDLNSLKDVLNTKHIPFKNRGILLEVNNKKVVYSHGHFYVDKVMVQPEQLLKSL